MTKLGLNLKQRFGGVIHGSTEGGAARSLEYKRQSPEMPSGLFKLPIDAEKRDHSLPSSARESQRL
jgi:hypothetical protein